MQGCLGCVCAHGGLQCVQYTTIVVNNFEYEMTGAQVFDVFLLNIPEISQSTT
jgi:hypothetical protein